MKQISSADIYRDIRNRLIAAEFQSGRRLKSDALRDSYGCAASTIREVLFRLASDGLVEFEDQKGFRMPDLSEKRLGELTNLRILLECEGARLSMERGDLTWEAGLTAAHHKLAHIENRIRALPKIEPPYIAVWCEAEWEFHETLISACGSDAMQEMHRSVYDRHRQHNLALSDNYSFRDENIVEHKAILDAALARDPASCAANIEIHLRRGLDAVLGRLKSGTRDEGRSVDGEAA